MRHALPDHATRGQEVLRLLPERILVIDGAMGTMLQQASLSAKDFGGPDLEGCNENLVVTRQQRRIKVEGHYTRDVLLAPGYTRPWNFAIDVLVLTLN